MGYTSYTVSKAALTHFASCVAREEAPKGIRINVISPGAVITDMLTKGFLGLEPNEER